MFRILYVFVFRLKTGTSNLVGGGTSEVKVSFIDYLFIQMSICFHLLLSVIPIFPPPNRCLHCFVWALGNGPFYIPRLYSFKKSLSQRKHAESNPKIFSVLVFLDATILSCCAKFTSSVSKTNSPSAIIRPLCNTIFSSSKYAF